MLEGSFLSTGSKESAQSPAKMCLHNCFTGPPISTYFVSPPISPFYICHSQSAVAAEGRVLFIYLYFRCNWDGRCYMFFGFVLLVLIVPADFDLQYKAMDWWCVCAGLKHIITGILNQRLKILTYIFPG